MEETFIEKLKFLSAVAAAAVLGLLIGASIGHFLVGAINIIRCIMGTAGMLGC